MIDQTKLNPLEQWIAEHSIRIFVVVTAVMMAGALFTLKLVVEQNETQSQVDVLRPQVTRVIHAASVCNVRALERKAASRACAERLRIALVNCRSHPSCRAAFLATLNYPPPARKGVVPSNPSPAGSQPAPPSGSAHKGGTRGGTKQAPKSHKPPSHAESASPPADTEPSQPGNSGNGTSAEHGVKACIDLAVSACVRAGATVP